MPQDTGTPDNICRKRRMDFSTRILKVNTSIVVVTSIVILIVDGAAFAAGIMLL